MTEMVHSILAQVPWLKTFLAWALAATIVVLVLALPAYFLFLALSQRLRAELARYVAAVRDRHAKNRAERKQAEQDFVAQFVQDRLLRHIDASSTRFWKRTKTALLQPAKEIQVRLANVIGSMEGFTKALPQVHERLQAITDAIPKDFHFVESEGSSLGQAEGVPAVVAG